MKNKVSLTLIVRARLIRADNFACPGLWCLYLPGSTVITCILYKVPMALYSSQGSCPQTDRPLQSPGHIFTIGGYWSRKGLDPKVPSVGVPPGVARFSRPVGGHTVWDPKDWYGAARRHQVYPDSILVGERYRRITVAFLIIFSTICYRGQNERSRIYSE